MSAQSNRKTTNCNSIDRVIYLRVAVEEGSKIILVCRLLTYVQLLSAISTIINP